MSGYKANTMSSGLKVITDVESMNKMNETIQSKIFAKYNVVNPPNILTNDYATNKSKVISQNSIASSKPEFIRTSK